MRFSSTRARLTATLVCTLPVFALFGLTACDRNENNDTEAVQVTKIEPADTQDVDAQQTTSETVDDADVEATVQAVSQSDELENEANQTSQDEGEGVLLTNDDIPQPPSDGVQAGDVAPNTPMSEETQITDVEYRGANGQSIMVTFQTSAVGALEADVKLPSGKRVLLTAPSGQGNNPTYENADGSIQLVSHGGGGSVDLLQNGQVTGFDAVSAEAEVISPQ